MRSNISNILRFTFSHKLSKTFSIYSLGRVIGVLVSLALLPLFTKQLPKAEFGIVGILWLINPLMSRLINLGLDVAVSLKFFKLNNKNLSLYLYNALLIITLCGFSLWAIGLWQIQWVQLVIEKDMSRIIFSLLFISILFSIYTTMMQSFLQLAGKAVQNVIMTILPPVIITVTTYILVMFVEKSYTSYVAGMAVGYGILGTVGLVYFFIRYSIKYFYISWSIIKRLLRVGLPVLPSTLGGIILASGDRYVIKHFIGLEAVAVYTYGYRFAEYILLSFFQPFQKALVPIVLEKAASNFEEASRYNNKIVFSTLTFFTILIAFIVIPFKDVMKTLGRIGYDQAYLIFLVTLLGVLLYNTSQINSILLNHLERTELNTLVVLFGACMNVGLNIWLIPKYGIVAAAVTTIISYLLMLVFTILVVNYFIPNKINLLAILLRLMPFLLYLVAIYYIEIINKDIIRWQAYILKLGLFICLILITWVLFPDIKSNISRVYSRFKIQRSGYHL